MRENKKIYKIILVFIYKKFINFFFWQRLVFFRKIQINIKPFFGGAYPGNNGGTLVKIKRLKNYFKEDKINYNIIYLLSNSIYYDFKYLQRLKNKIPIIHNQNGVFYDAWYAGDSKSENSKMSNQLHIADYVFYQSKFCKISADKFLGIRKKDFEILYNAVDLNKFKSIKKNFNPNKKIKILTTGTFRPYMLKGLISAINAIDILRHIYPVSYSIAGFIDNFSKKYLLNIIDQKNLKNHIFFTGAYKQEYAEHIYNNHDIFFFFVQNAPCPNALIEAISCSLPIVFSDSGSSKEIVNNGGIGVQSQLSWTDFHFFNQYEIANATQKIIENYNFFSVEARKSALEKHDINLWVKKHNNIFKNYLKKLN